MKYLYFLTIILSLIGIPTSTMAGNVEKQMELILSSAERICNVVKMEGNSKRIEGNIGAELGGLAKKLVGAGLNTAGKITTEDYEGVLRQDLGPLARDTVACRLHVFDSLQKQLLQNRSNENNLTSPSGSAENRPIQYSTFTGIWSGSVYCNNGQVFSVKLELSRGSGDTASGSFSWGGSNTGRDSATLAPDPNGSVPADYLLVTRHPATYKYRLTRLSDTRMRGSSLGPEGCKIEVAR